VSQGALPLSFLPDTVIYGQSMKEPPSNVHGLVSLNFIEFTFSEDKDPAIK
jgi:hypothetical protein